MFNSNVVTSLHVSMNSSIYEQVTMKNNEDLWPDPKALKGL